MNLATTYDMFVEVVLLRFKYIQTLLKSDKKRQRPFGPHSIYTPLTPLTVLYQLILMVFKSKRQFFWYFSSYPNAPCPEATRVGAAAF